MSKQGYKHGGWKQKYVLRRVCEACEGDGWAGCHCGERSVGECRSVPRSCDECGGTGSRPVDEHALYFVLRLDEDPHALVAATAYANSVESDNKQLADDVWAKVREAQK